MNKIRSKTAIKKRLAQYKKTIKTTREGSNGWLNATHCSKELEWVLNEGDEE